MTLDRATGAIGHHVFRDLPSLLRHGDLLIANDTRVIPARLFARVGDREVEVLLLRREPSAPNEQIWSTLARPAKVLKPGVSLAFTDPAYRGEVLGSGERGVRHVAFRGTSDFDAWLSRVGHVPLPPYIDRPDQPEDRERYQTIFARERGAVAAPTAGLHFTPRLLEELRGKGVHVAPITLHVGPGTFLPVRARRVEDHRMHRERYHVPAATAEAVASARGRVIAVGTTALRTLEAAHDGEALREGPGSTDLFITPGYRFRAVQGLLTNFHLPRSTLLMLVSAFAGLPRIQAAYAASSP